MMHTYKKQDDKWLVGYYAPVTYFNPIFGPREVSEWETVTEAADENQAQILTAKLNGAGQCSGEVDIIGGSAGGPASSEPREGP